MLSRHEKQLQQRNCRQNTRLEIAWVWDPASNRGQKRCREKHETCFNRHLRARSGFNRKLFTICAFCQEHYSVTIQSTSLTNTFRHNANLYWEAFVARFQKPRPTQWNTVQHNNTYSNYNIWYVPLFCEDLRKNKNFKSYVTNSFHFYFNNEKQSYSFFSSLLLSFFEPCCFHVLVFFNWTVRSQSLE